MQSQFQQLAGYIEEIEIPSVTHLSDFISEFRLNLPVVSDDLILSVVLVDLTRDPIGLISKFRSNNFPGFKVEYYNKLNANLQQVKDNTLISNLVRDRNLIVIEDVNDIIKEDPVDDFEKEFMQKNGWKSVIYHSLFHGNITYGYLCLFTLEKRLTKIQIETIVDFYSVILPRLGPKILPLAYQWKSELYRKDIEELEDNLSDLVIAITGKGTIVRVNDLSNYYLGSSPDDLLGKNLQDICEPLYNGIMTSIDWDDSKVYPAQVEIASPSGQKVVLELRNWQSNLSSDNTIICYASDITLLKLYESMVEDI